MLLALALSLVGPSSGYTPPSRDDVVTTYQKVLSGNDRDHDGRLSLAEWGTMIDVVFPATPRPDEAASNYDEARRSSLDMHRLQDMNHDGFLTLDELVRLPLAGFDCSDTNRDRRLSEAEMWRGMGRCATMVQTEGGLTIRTPAPAPAGASPPAH